MKNLDDILRATRTPAADVSINLENQPVYVRAASGKYRRTTRTIYRARFEENVLVGHLHQRNTTETWPQVFFDLQKRTWHGRERHT